MFGEEEAFDDEKAIYTLLNAVLLRFEQNEGKLDVFTQRNIRFNLKFSEYLRTMEKHDDALEFLERAKSLLEHGLR